MSSIAALGDSIFHISFLNFSFFIGGLIRDDWRELVVFFETWTDLTTNKHEQILIKMKNENW